MMSNIEAMATIPFLLQAKKQVDQALNNLLPLAQPPNKRLKQAMRYVATNGGKRIRAALVYASGEIFAAPSCALNTAACAIELVHSYSLVHDDLPAMDDDQLRRGQATCHIAYDEATAILVGDALQCLAFNIIANDNQAENTLSASQRLAMLQTLSYAAGVDGMVGGQALDIQATGQQLSKPELDRIHNAKTGALISASVVLGAMCSNHELSTEENSALNSYASEIGLAFQIQDDILDVVGDQLQLGKLPGADERHTKATYPSLLGVEQAIIEAKLCHNRALSALNIFADKAASLRAISHYIIERIC